jgi:hypothetical protein
MRRSSKTPRVRHAFGGAAAAWLRAIKELRAALIKFADTTTKLGSSSGTAIEMKFESVSPGPGRMRHGKPNTGGKTPASRLRPLGSSITT